MLRRTERLYRRVCSASQRPGARDFLVLDAGAGSAVLSAASPEERGQKLIWSEPDRSGAAERAGVGVGIVSARKPGTEWWPGGRPG